MYVHFHVLKGSKQLTDVDLLTVRQGRNVNIKSWSQNADKKNYAKETLLKKQMGWCDLKQ